MAIPINGYCFLFNAFGIAVTLFIIFASILPLLYVIHGDNKIAPVNLPSSKTIAQPTEGTVVESSSSLDDIDEDWVDPES